VSVGVEAPAYGTPAVDVERLAVTLGGNEAVRGVSVTAERGEWLAVIGPNGAGKTTLLRAVAGLVPFRGSVALEGQAVAGRTRRDVARFVALVPQIPNTPPALTVAEYVLLGRTPHIGYLATERRSDQLAAARALSRLALGPLAHRSLDTLSGGERQRAVLARALAQEASILLLDEPTSALDIGHQQDVLELVEALRVERGLAVLSTMHDLTLAGLYADELVLLNAGRVVERGPAGVVLTEEHLSAHFGASVSVLPGADGPVVVPQRTPRAGTGGLPRAAGNGSPVEGNGSP
jgi:iron complex transport system ATP-binding protein